MLMAIVTCTLGLVVIHLFGARLRFLDDSPRSVWLSAAGGLSVAYVFIHLLPELAEGQEIFRKAVRGVLSALDEHAYLMALLGLVAFYGLERAAKESRVARGVSLLDESPNRGVFWLHMTSFSLYNVLIGYLLANNFHAIRPLTFFFIAMALHFVVTDFGLSERFKKAYASVGRWILSAAVAVGAVLGTFMKIPDLATSALVAVLAGGVILNVLKEELPEERQSRFVPFLLGAAAYAGLLLAF